MEVCVETIMPASAFPAASLPVEAPQPVPADPQPSAGSARIPNIVHVDVDAFFASVEQVLNPKLRGKPVLVGRGVVASASYEAKLQGVKTAMTFREARRICLGKKKINFSRVFAGQAVGIKEVHDGIWLVSFMDYDLGYFDLETRVLAPLENPFGPKV